MNVESSRCEKQWVDVTDQTSAFDSFCEYRAILEEPVPAWEKTVDPNPWPAKMALSPVLITSAILRFSIDVNHTVVVRSDKRDHLLMNWHSPGAKIRLFQRV